MRQSRPVDPQSLGFSLESQEGPRYTILDIMGDSSQESQRWRSALALLDDQSQDFDPCPAPQEIFDTVAGLANPEIRRRVVAHIGRCPACAQAWRCAMRLLSGGGPEAVDAVECESLGPEFTDSAPF